MATRNPWLDIPESDYVGQTFDVTSRFRNASF